MSSYNKLYFARLGAIVLAVLILSLILTYHQDVNDHILNETAQFLGDAYSQMDGVANR